MSFKGAFCVLSGENEWNIVIEEIYNQKPAEVQWFSSSKAFASHSLLVWKNMKGPQKFVWLTQM